MASSAIAHAARNLTCTALHAEAYASEAYLEAEMLNSEDFSKQDLQYRLLVGSLRVTSSQVRGDLHTTDVHRHGSLAVRLTPNARATVESILLLVHPFRRGFRFHPADQGSRPEGKGRCEALAADPEAHQDPLCF